MLSHASGISKFKDSEGWIHQDGKSIFSSFNSSPPTSCVANRSRPPLVAAFFPEEEDSFPLLFSFLASQILKVIVVIVVGRASPRRTRGEVGDGEGCVIGSRGGRSVVTDGRRSSPSSEDARGPSRQEEETRVDAP